MHWQHTSFCITACTRRTDKHKHKHTHTQPHIIRQLPALRNQKSQINWSANNILQTPILVPRGLRRGSAAARLLGLWVRILRGAWMAVCCECCVLSGRGLCYGWLFVVSVVCCQVEVCALDVCLLWLLCVVRSSISRAGLSSRELLPAVACLSMIVKPR